MNTEWTECFEIKIDDRNIIGKVSNENHYKIITTYKKEFIGDIKKEGSVTIMSLITSADDLIEYNGSAIDELKKDIISDMQYNEFSNEDIDIIVNSFNIK